VQQQRTVGDTFAQLTAGQTIVDSLKLDLLVGSGGVLSHAPRMHQTAMMLIDAFQPEGVTTLAKDSIFMMPHLGVLAQVHPEAAMQVFERDCLIYLGTCVAPRGIGRPGKPCFQYDLDGQRGQMLYGELALLPLGPGDTAKIAIHPARGFDAGAGPGRSVQKEIRGGTVGLVLDARGRPLALPETRREAQAAVERWITALDLYPEMEAVA
jgi:hypothetical protein